VCAGRRTATGDARQFGEHDAAIDLSLGRHFHIGIAAVPNYRHRLKREWLEFSHRRNQIRRGVIG